MKPIIAIILCCLATFSFSQSPNEISYQAVLRDTDGKILSGKTVNFKLVLHESSAVGKLVYSESHQVKTNRNGLVSFVIGKGKKLTGDFSKIMWVKGDFFMESLVDEKGGTNFKSIGTTKLMSVPYALHSNTADSLTSNKYQKQIDSLNAALKKIKIANDQSASKRKVDSLLNALKTPSISSIRIIPSKITAGTELLLVQYSFISFAQKEDKSKIKWYKNGNKIAEDKVDLKVKFKKGDKVKVEIEPKDGISSGKKVIYSASVVNSIPDTYGVYVEKKKNIISAIYQYYDADGDKDQSTFKWYVNGVLKGTKKTLDVKSVFDKTKLSNKVKLELIVSDGEYISKKPFVVEKIFENKPIVEFNLNCNEYDLRYCAIQRTGETLYAYYSYYDTDGNKDKSTFKWYVNGILKGTKKTLSIKGIFDKTKTSNNKVKLEMTVSNGIYTSKKPLVAERVFENSKPKVEFSSYCNKYDKNRCAIQKKGETLYAYYSYYDADGSKDKSTFKWYVNGILKGTKKTLAIKDNFDKDKENKVRLEMIVSDGIYTSEKPLVAETVFDNINTLPNGNNVYSGKITKNITLKSNQIHIIKGRVIVKPGVTVTIEAGTIIKGQEGTGVDASVLHISRGAKIIAKGTAKSPIIFTSTKDNIKLGQKKGTNLEVTDNKLWGGLVILGKAPISAKQGAEAEIEGVPASEKLGLYGGLDRNDNSGVLEYVSVRHGGAIIDGKRSVASGIEFAGVGSSTVVKNIEIYGGGDDGIRFYGGHVKASNLFINSVGDDAIDIDQGYSGTIDNFILYANKSTNSDKGLEIDGPESSKNEDGTFTINRGTITSIKSGGNAIMFKSGAQGKMNNVISEKFNQSIIFIDSFLSKNTYNNLLMDKLKIVNSKFDVIKVLGKSHKISPDESRKANEKIKSSNEATGADKSKFKGWTISEIK